MCAAESKRAIGTSTKSGSPYDCGAIAERERFGLSDAVEGEGAARSFAAQIVAVEHVQDLEHDAAGARRRGADHRQAVIVRGERLTQPFAVAAQVRSGRGFPFSAAMASAIASPIGPS